MPDNIFKPVSLGDTDEIHPPGAHMASPLNNLPAYRVLTGPDDATFCRRVSEALALGYELHGSPAVTFNSKGSKGDGGN